jgi:hypothetical protein
MRRGRAAFLRAACPALGLAAALLGASAKGHTQSAPTREPKAAAQALFDEAMTLRKKGAWSDACARLDESLRLDPAPGTKFYLAECLEKTGKLASAWLLYTEVADRMASTGQQKRETFARERAAALSTRVARLQVVVPDAARVPGLVVRRDGVVLGEAQWGFASPVDLGPHTIEATAPDRAPFSRTVDLREPGKTVTLELPPWPRPAVTAAPTVTAAPVVPPPEPRRLPFSLRTAGFVLGGLGLAGAGVGAALGSLAISRQAESNRGPCDAARDVCSPEGIALRADAMTAATGSTISFVTAGVLFAAGVVLVVWPASPAPAAAKGAAGPDVALNLHPNGLSLEGRW